MVIIVVVCLIVLVGLLGVEKVKDGNEKFLVIVKFMNMVLFLDEIM